MYIRLASATIAVSQCFVHLAHHFNYHFISVLCTFGSPLPLSLCPSALYILLTTVTNTLSQCFVHVAHCCNYHFISKFAHLARHCHLVSKFARLTHRCHFALRLVHLAHQWCYHFIVRLLRQSTRRKLDRYCDWPRVFDP